jgi:hypothetical protein
MDFSKCETLDDILGEFEYSKQEYESDLAIIKLLEKSETYKPLLSFLKWITCEYKKMNNW